MILPSSIPHSLKCPFCDKQDVKLEWQKANTGSMSETLVYYCDNCKYGFTTTESDKISLKRYYSKKRSVYRKYKIKRLYENLDS